MDDGIRMVAFDGDDTLWRSQDVFDAAQSDSERIVGACIDLADARVHERPYACGKANLAWFGYGVKDMALSMIEAAVEITGARIAADDVHRIVRLAKDLLRHPVELLPGIREAVAKVAAAHGAVLITRGGLFHQERKGWTCSGRAESRIALIFTESTGFRCKFMRPRCAPAMPFVAQSCPGFAANMEAA